MATLADFVSKVLMELGDQPKQFTKTFTGDGSTVDFVLGVKPVDTSTLLVTVNGAAKANPTHYTIEAQHGVIHFVTAPPLNHVVSVSGSVFRYFSDSEIRRSISSCDKRLLSFLISIFLDLP